MTIEQFRILNEMEQVCAILESGKLMAQHAETDHRMFLYRMETFYVSATYNNSDDQLSEITCFIEIDQAIPHFRKKLTSINPAEREFNIPKQ